ncbi:Phytochrome-like protein cph2 [Vibrio aerogenes CECT 7868]|uniref:cyclic-guanylate-specific phosphodiesterase n=1 Tax=Vibrio aerogenes CECT 7868 TaxID=1216006 RepID=A0A1M5Y4H5_9VIBR|nr:bifunctional diguanylate cyclase/phosphodiesterase [Vibrio aerogenes]SHI06876.1 Phytochrome-like protein cph2 [Vibrio aerogenes CECT 7868]
MTDDKDERSKQREQIIGLGERSFRKSYYPQFKRNTERLERFKTLLDQTSDFVMLVSLPDLLITDVNRATELLFDARPGRLTGHSLNSLPLDDIDAMVTTLKSDLLRAKKQASIETHFSELKLIREQRPVWLDLSYRVARLERQYYAVMVGRDITERKHQHELLERLLAEKEAILDNAIVGLAWVRDRMIIACNRRLEEMLGYAPGSMVGKSTRILYESDETFSDFGTDAYRALSSGEAFTGATQLCRANGKPIWCELTGNSIDACHQENGSVWIISDIHQLRLTQEKAVFLSHHDALTQLPNHRLLEDRLNQAVTAAAQKGKVVGLINLDLDRFKHINELLGYHDSNQLLVQVAKRLSSCLGGQGTLFRQGGDEFLILLPELSDTDGCFPVLSQIFVEFEQEFIVNEHELLLSCSLGVAFYPQDGESFEELLSKADMAMYQAKDAGRNTYRFFSAEMNELASQQLTIAFDLRKALELDQFELYYQPQIDIATGRLIGAEALIRWHHPTLGLVSPGQFIPVAEETGLIVPIGEWVLQQACHAADSWRQHGFDHSVVAVNLSAVQFAQGNIEDAVYRAIKSSGIFPEMLELELTESIMLRDTDNVLATVKRLKLMGCKLSIDDFGTGYSSLAYLKRFAVDKLKIDQVFIQELTQNPDDAVIVRTVIHMAKSLGLKTIAEGIETEEVLELLKVYQCDEAQGYFTGRPMPAAGFLAYLKQCFGS